MADLQVVLSQAVKLDRSISQFLKFSTYTGYDDLSGLGIDCTDGEQQRSTTMIAAALLTLVTDEYHDIPYWTRTVVEHNGLLPRWIQGLSDERTVCPCEIGNMIHQASPPAADEQSAAGVFCVY